MSEKADLQTRYKHEKCGTVTVVGTRLAQQLNEGPYFLDAVPCALCNVSLPLNQFVWVTGYDDSGGEIEGKRLSESLKEAESA